MVWAQWTTFPTRLRACLGNQLPLSFSGLVAKIAVFGMLVISVTTLRLEAEPKMVMLVLIAVVGTRIVQTVRRAKFG